jgi:hypothetical protein
MERDTHSEMVVENQNTQKSANWKSWLKKFGIIGFMFFFIKGLVWLAVIFGLGKYIFGG